MTTLSLHKQKLLEEFQKTRTDAITEMFDNKYANGIYPTSKFFETLDAAIIQAIDQTAELTFNEVKLNELKIVHAINTKTKEELIMPEVNSNVKYGYNWAVEIIQKNYEEFIK